MQAFNRMATQLQAQERLIHVTRLASWQALARKMARSKEFAHADPSDHGGNRQPPGRSLTARFEQAAQIVADEVNTLEKRVRAFSEFSAELRCCLPRST
jgi:hypothetical protein